MTFTLTLKRSEVSGHAGAIQYREYDTQGNITLERHSVHVSDGGNRMCLLETTTTDTTQASTVPNTLARYQFTNNIGSATLELDNTAALISYEEYYPYGATALQTGTNAAEVSLKRYRYTGKERDNESGLTYHGARYHAPWLGRWTACDPAGLADGINVYAYVGNNPVCLSDPTGTQGEAEKPVILEAEVRLYEHGNWRTVSHSRDVIPRNVLFGSEATPSEPPARADISGGADAPSGVDVSSTDWTESNWLWSREDSKRVGWVFDPREYDTFEYEKTVPDTGSILGNYALGALYSARNVIAALENAAIGLPVAANKELEKAGLPLEAIPADQVPLFIGESLQYILGHAQLALGPSTRSLGTANMVLGEVQWGAPVRPSGVNEQVYSGFPLAPVPPQLAIPRVDTARVLARAAAVGPGDLGHNFPALLEPFILSGPRYLRFGTPFQTPSITYSSPGFLNDAPGFWEIGALQDGLLSERVIHRSFTGKGPKLPF